MLDRYLSVGSHIPTYLFSLLTKEFRIGGTVPIEINRRDNESTEDMYGD